MSVRSLFESLGTLIDMSGEITIQMCSFSFSFSFRNIFVTILEAHCISIGQYFAHILEMKRFLGDLQTLQYGTCKDFTLKVQVHVIFFTVFRQKFIMSHVCKVTLMYIQLMQMSGYLIF